MNSKDLIIQEIRAQNDQLKVKVRNLEKTELDLFVFFIENSIPLYENNDSVFGRPYTLLERAKLLKAKYDQS